MVEVVRPASAAEDGSSSRRLGSMASKIVRRVAQKFASVLVINTVGRLLNGSQFPIIFEHRPDALYEFRRFPDFGRLFASWAKGNGLNNSGDVARFYALLLNCRAVIQDGVAGDFVELGVYKGNSAAILADFARGHGRRLFLFDTFVGFDDRDIETSSKRVKAAFKDTSLEAVRAFVGEDQVTYVKGFFPSSCHGIALPERIAVAHIDCDLHDPMKAALEMFYPLMSPGGLIIMHDYSSGYWPGATRAVDDFFADKPERPVLMPDKSGTAVVRVHARERRK